MISNEDASFALPMPNNYKLSITGSISYTAGITTTGGQVHDKLVVRVSGGYSVTTSAPLTFNTNLIIWFNP